MHTLLTVVAATLVLLAATTSDAAAAVLRGEVTYRERIALPPETVVHVRLVDASRQDVAAEVLADTRTRALEGPPYGFALEVPAALFDAGRDLRLQATLSAHGRVVMRSHEPVAVDRSTAADAVRILVHTAGEAVASAELALVCRGNEPFWNLEIDGVLARLSELGGTWPQASELAGTVSRLDWAEPERFVWRGGPPLGEAGRLEPP